MRHLNLFPALPRPVSNLVRQLKETLVSDKEDKDLSHYVSDLVCPAGLGFGRFGVAGGGVRLVPIWYDYRA
jgi:hypothetical protein